MFYHLLPQKCVLDVVNNNLCNYNGGVMNLVNNFDKCQRDCRCYFWFGRIHMEMTYYKDINIHEYMLQIHNLDKK